MNRLRWLGGLVALAASPAFAQALGGAPASPISPWRVVGALVICLLFAVGAAFAMRSKLSGVRPPVRRGANRARLLETFRLSHQTDICLIACDDREILLAVAPSGVVVLHNGQDASTPAGEEAR